MKTTLGLAVLVMLVTACSGGGGGGTGGGTGGSGGSGTGGGTGTAGGGALPTTNIAYVSLSQIDTNSILAVTRSASAGFYPSGPPVPVGGTSCSFSTMGGCDISDCFNDGGLPSFDGGATVGAGTVTVQAAGLSIPLTPSPFGYSGQANDGGLWWNGGEAVTATGTGMTMGAPAFNASLMAPTRMNITAPAAAMITVTRGTALPISWTAGTGTISISLYSGMLVGGRSVKATCNVPATPGSFSIPGPVTNLLVIGNQGTLQLTNSTETVSTVSGWTIRTSAGSTGPTKAVTVQ